MDAIVCGPGLVAVAVEAMHGDDAGEREKPAGQPDGCAHIVRPVMALLALEERG